MADAAVIAAAAAAAAAANAAFAAAAGDALENMEEAVIPEQLPEVRYVLALRKVQGAQVRRFRPSSGL